MDPLPDYPRRIATTEEVPVAMQIAIMRGLSGVYSHLEPHCPSRTCDYSDFVSLGICSSCEDVTSQSRQDCVAATRSLEKEQMGKAPINCTYTSPNGFNITPDVVSASSVWQGSDGGPGGPGQPLYLISGEVSWQPWTSVVTSNTSFTGPVD